MASLVERIRVNRAHGTRNTMTDYGNAEMYDIDEYEETRDRLRAKIARLRRHFEACCQCGHTESASTIAIDLAHWSNKLVALERKRENRLFWQQHPAW